VPEEVAPREVYGIHLVELGRENKDIVALDADVAVRPLTACSKRAFPERFIEVGIAEANIDRDCRRTGR